MGSSSACPATLLLSPLALFDDKRRGIHPPSLATADYFGPLPNLAARVMASAQYGQTLIEPSRELDVNWTEPSPRLHGTDGSSDSIQLTLLGKFSLKGVPTDTVLAQAMPISLMARTFEDPSGRVSAVSEIPSASVSAQGAGNTSTKTSWNSAATPHTPHREGVNSPASESPSTVSIPGLQRRTSAAGGNPTHARLTRRLSQLLPKPTQLPLGGASASAGRPSFAYAASVLTESGRRKHGAATESAAVVAATEPAAGVPELKLPKSRGSMRNRLSDREAAIFEVTDESEAAIFDVTGGGASAPASPKLGCKPTVFAPFDGGAASVLLDVNLSSSAGHSQDSANRPAYPAAPQLRKPKARGDLASFEMVESDEDCKAERDGTLEPPSPSGGSIQIVVSQNGDTSSSPEFRLVQEPLSGVTELQVDGDSDGGGNRSNSPRRTHIAAGELWMPPDAPSAGDSESGLWV